MTENEYLGLKLTDGMYEEANKSYYVSYSKDRQLKTNIAYILHQADMMASKIENDQWARGEHDIKVEKEVEVQKKSEQSLQTKHLRIYLEIKMDLKDSIKERVGKTWNSVLIEKLGYYLRLENS